MKDNEVVDPSEKWEQRLARVRRFHARSDVTSMTRPPRDPEKRQLLEEMGLLGPYQETEDDEGWEQRRPRALGRSSE